MLGHFYIIIPRMYLMHCSNLVMLYADLTRLSSVLFGESSGNISQSDELAWNSCLSTGSANICQLSTSSSAVRWSSQLKCLKMTFIPLLKKTCSFYLCLAN